MIRVSSCRLQVATSHSVRRCEKIVGADVRSLGLCENPASLRRILQFLHSFSGFARAEREHEAPDHSEGAADEQPDGSIGRIASEEPGHV